MNFNNRYKKNKTPKHQIIGPPKTQKKEQFTPRNTKKTPKASPKKSNADKKTPKASKTNLKKSTIAKNSISSKSTTPQKSIVSKSTDRAKSTTGLGKSVMDKVSSTNSITGKTFNKKASKFSPQTTIPRSKRAKSTPGRALSSKLNSSTGRGKVGRTKSAPIVGGSGETNDTTKRTISPTGKVHAHKSSPVRTSASFKFQGATRTRSAKERMIPDVPIRVSQTDKEAVNSNRNLHVSRAVKSTPANAQKFRSYNSGGVTTGVTLRKASNIKHLAKETTKVSNSKVIGKALVLKSKLEHTSGVSQSNGEADDQEEQDQNNDEAELEGEPQMQQIGSAIVRQRTLIEQIQEKIKEISGHDVPPSYIYAAMGIVSLLLFLLLF